MIRKTIIAVLTLAAFGTLIPSLIGVLGSVGMSWKQQNDQIIRSVEVNYTIVEVSFCSGSFLYRSIHTNHDAPPPLGANFHLHWFWIWDIKMLAHGLYDCGFQLNDFMLYLYCPAWSIVGVFATYPAIAFIRGPWRRYRRRKKGLCVKCGYDLTGNESGVCSECGAETK